MPRNWEARDKKLGKRDKQARMRGNRSVFLLAEAAERRNAREQELYERKRRKEKGYE